ncbi:MAG: threonine ammonia-lyase [Peptostreptococcaceae bacterium]
MKQELTLLDVLQAKVKINEYIKNTPLIRAYNLEKLFNGAQIYLKLENLQHTGSFKIRGVANKMLNLSKKELEKGVTAASSGNHAQAVSYMANKIGTNATIVMPENAPKAKIEGTKEHGANVVLCGFTGEERDYKCNELIETYRYSLIHSHMDPYVIAGHSTVVLEAWEQMNFKMDEIIVPCGSGSLASGAAFTMKQLDKSIKVTGVEPASVPLFTNSLKANKPLTVNMGETIADGLRVSKAENINFNLISNNIDSIETVEEDTIKKAVKEIGLKEKITAEPSACVGLAVLFENKIDTSKDRKICIVISGGNIDASLYSEILAI